MDSIHAERGPRMCMGVKIPGILIINEYKMNTISG